MRRGPVALGVLVVALLVALAFQAPPVERVEHFAANEPAVIAHAGAQGHAPGNTLPAFDRALELGADTLEMDLQLSADGELVAIHDGTVDRTTDGSGAVAEHTVDELRELDAGYTWQDADGDTPFRGQGVRIPTLYEIVERFPETFLVLEMKTDGGPAIVDATVEAVAEHDLAARVAVASFDVDYVQRFRVEAPGVPTNMPEGETETLFVLGLLGLDRWWTPPAELLQVPERHEGTQVVSPAFVAAAERRGADVQVWTVNDEAAMHRLLNTGVHGLITDYPDRMVAALDERAAAATERADADRHPGLGVVHALQDAGAWLADVARAVSFLGDREFAVLVFPLLYWSVHRRLGLQLGVLLLISAGLNEALKLATRTPRPAFVDPAVGLAHETSFGVPSGHAQNGVVVWGLLATELRRRWALAVALVLVLALGWSRLQLGVHFPLDTVVGWGVGLALLAGYLAARGRLHAWLAARTPRGLLATAFAASLALIGLGVLARLLAWGWMPPPTWIGVAPAEPPTGLGGVVTPAAALFGLAVGVVWLRARGGFDTAGAWWRRALRYPVGLVGVLLLAEGLGALLPVGDDPVALIYRYLRYALVGAWVGGLAPWLFVRLRLAPPAPPDPRPAAGRGRPAAAL